jgi:hypothetical protein
MHLEGVLVFQISVEDNVLHVKLDSTNTLSVYHVVVIHMEVLVYHVIMMVNVNVHQILMANDVINVKKDFITILHVRVVIVILLV